MAEEVRDSREILIHLLGAGTEPIEFRNILENKKVKGMQVDKAVKLYSDEGFKVRTENKPEYPFKLITGAVGNIKSVGKLARVINAVGSGVLAGLETNTESTLWAPWIDNVQAFGNSGPITLSFKLEFHMGEFGLWDAKEEVFLPVMNLMGLFLPKGIHGINVDAHLRTNTRMLWDFIKAVYTSGTNFAELFSAFSAKPDGPDAITSASSGEVGAVAPTQTGTMARIDATIGKLSTAMDTIIMSTIDGSDSKYGYYVNIGYANNKFRFTRMQPTNCSIKFSNKEYDDNGYPAVGEIQMEFVSMQPGTLNGLGMDASGNASITFGFIQETI